MPRLIAEPEIGKSVDPGPRSWSQPNVWEARKAFERGWRAGSTSELKIRSLAAQLVPGAHTWRWGRAAQVEGGVNECKD